jgi:hypothetical protein
LTDSPHTRFVEALEAASWTVVVQAPFIANGGPNPTRLFVRRGARTLRLLVYAWNITLEGVGRKKAGRDDLDYRVQTTRTHDGDLINEPGLIVVGLGWNEERCVFVAFDPWLKRTTGRSSSVHITRALLDRAAAEGWAEEDRDDGPECSFRATEVQRSLQWLFDLQEPRYGHIEPTSFVRDDSHCTVVVRVPGRVALELRVGDHLTVEGHDDPLDPSVWEIAEVNANHIQGDTRYQRIELTFRGRLIGLLSKS